METEGRPSTNDVTKIHYDVENLKFSALQLFGMIALMYQRRN